MLLFVRYRKLDFVYAVMFDLSYSHFFFFGNMLLSLLFNIILCRCFVLVRLFSDDQFLTSLLLYHEYFAVVNAFLMMFVFVCEPWS